MRIIIGLCLLSVCFALPWNEQQKRDAELKERKDHIENILRIVKEADEVIQAQSHCHHDCVPLLECTGAHGLVQGMCTAETVCCDKPNHQPVHRPIVENRMAEDEEEHHLRNILRRPKRDLSNEITAEDAVGVFQIALSEESAGCPEGACIDAGTCGLFRGRQAEGDCDGATVCCVELYALKDLIVRDDGEY